MSALPWESVDSKLSETVVLRPACVLALWVKKFTANIEPDQKSMAIIFKKARLDDSREVQHC